MSNTRKKTVAILVGLLLAVLLSLLFVNLNQIVVLAESEIKTYCSASLEDDFAEDRVIISLSQSESQKLKDYTVDDFPGIRLSAVKDLTQSVKEKLRQSMYSVQQSDFLLNRDEFRIILSLTLQTPGKQNVLSTIKILEKRKEIICAEPDYVMIANSEPNDAEYTAGNLWGLNGTYGVQAPEAWKYTTGSSDVKVGVIDSGISATHNDLKYRVNTELYKDCTEISDSGYGTGALIDSIGHGTHVAGIIGAQGNNNIGITGLNWNVNLISIKISDDGNFGSFSSRLIQAVEFAIKEGIPILNNSNGADDYTGSSQSLETTLKMYSGIFISSAGNKSKDNDDNWKRFPSNIRLRNTITVGAINENGKRYSYSNYGYKTVDIFAPGGSILSTYPTQMCQNICHKPDEELSDEQLKIKNSHQSDGFHFMSGTSMAAPHVAGTAALMLSVNPKLTGAELKEIICKTVVVQDNLLGFCATGGRLNAYKAVVAAKNVRHINFNKQNGDGGTDSVLCYIGEDMPKAIAPTRLGYNFKGYFTAENGGGDQYYGENMESKKVWDIEGEPVTLYVKWEPKTYTVTVKDETKAANADDYPILTSFQIKTGEPIPRIKAPTKQHYRFVGLYTDVNKGGDQYADRCYENYAGQYLPTFNSCRTWDIAVEAPTLYAGWDKLDMVCNIPTVTEDGSRIGSSFTYQIKSGEQTSIAAPDISGYQFLKWKFNGQDSSEKTLRQTFELKEMTGQSAGTPYLYNGSDTITPGYIKAIYKKTCIAEGSLITLADGSQVPVENLTGDEMLLVWNFYTGTFDAAPILLIDKDPAREYKVVNVSFSDGTTVKVISEHGFFDFDLNKYVYLDENAAQYLGHWFNKQTTDEYGNFTYTRVQLVSVNITTEYTTAWSPETCYHFCIYVNGMLTMPGGSEGLFNIFEVDAETMRYDEEAFRRDIELYGLFTYEEFYEQIPVPEELFELYNAQYFKVAIGKGLTTMEQLQQLALQFWGSFEQ